MDLFQILILSVVQGAAELLPVSSSAHVIVVEKLMGLDPTSPELTMLLVMLHTGTMFAAIVYFWNAWRNTYFSSMRAFRSNMRDVVIATIATGLVGLVLLQLITYLLRRSSPGFEIEHLFGNSRLMAGALAAAGILILCSSRVEDKGNQKVSLRSAVLIGVVQGLCLPFRGFSRSGATISTGLVLGVTRRKAEEFSFALAVALTPAVIVREAYRLYKSQANVTAVHTHDLMQVVAPSLIGMVFSFAAGLVALRWLSTWLEQGRWHFFGAYCMVASMFVLWVG